jgi:outer membrane protein assembly factor BamB
MRRIPELLLAAAALLAAHPAAADDWPQFRGPDRTGISQETNLARTWPEGGPKVLWSVELGEGYAGAAVRDGEVYVLDREDRKRDILRCFDLAGGRETWRFAYDAPGDYPHEGSRNVPTVGEKRIYIVGPMGHFHCIDRKTRQVLWSKHLVRDFRSRYLPKALRLRDPMWGMSHVPLLYRETVVVAPHSVEAGLVAYDRAIGKMKWRSPDIGTNRFSHVTSTLTTLCGVDQFVTIAIQDGGMNPAAVISGIEAGTGRLLWQMQTSKRYNCPVPSPVAMGADRFFVTGGYRIGCFALQVRRGDDDWSGRYVFKDSDAVTSHIHTPVFYKGCIYAQSYDGFHERRHNGLVCMDASGRIAWKTGPERHFGSGALLIADGLIYVMDGRRGVLHLVEATPERYHHLAEAKVLPAKGRKVWAPMALSQGKLIVRDLHVMKCLDVRKPPAASQGRTPAPPAPPSRALP